MNAFAWLQAAGAGGIWPATVAGWVPIGGVLIGVASGAIATYYAVKIKPIAEQVEKWKPMGETPLATKHELNGLGTRVKEVETAMATARGEGEARLRTLEQLIRDHEGEIRRAHEDAAKVQTWMARCSSEQLGSKAEILGSLSERSTKTDAAISALTTSVAVLTNEVEHLKEAKE